MSLLLDARKKLQQAQSAQSGSEKLLAGHPDGSHSGQEPGVGGNPDSAPSKPDLPRFANPRSAGQNLFNAKFPASSLARASINRNLLIALGGTVLLLAAGGAYVWYIVSAGDTPAAVPRSMPTPATTPPQDIVAPRVDAPQAASNPSESVQPAHPARPTTRTPAPRSRKSNDVSIERQAEPIDPLLNDAYLAYRSGKYEQAQQLYRQVLNLDARNADALLGMAAIAQHRGSDKEAAHYYSQALVLDPRNAVANAGMSALATDDNRESRLKNLLNEQRDSSSLHFALGNHYASQARWGEAQQSYANAYRLEPDNAELAFNLAVSLDRLGKNDLAVQHYQRALQLDLSHSAGFDHAQVEQRVQELTR